jgi:hypothetical protein
VTASYRRAAWVSLAGGAITIVYAARMAFTAPAGPVCSVSGGDGVCTLPDWGLMTPVVTALCGLALVAAAAPIALLGVLRELQLTRQATTAAAPVLPPSGTRRDWGSAEGFGGADDLDGLDGDR